MIRQGPRPRPWLQTKPRLKTTKTKTQEQRERQDNSRHRTDSNRWCFSWGKTYKIIQVKTNGDKTRQDKTRQAKPRQDKTRRTRKKTKYSGGRGGGPQLKCKTNIKQRQDKTKTRQRKIQEQKQGLQIQTKRQGPRQTKTRHDKDLPLMVSNGHSRLFSPLTFYALGQDGQDKDQIERQI